MVHAQWWCTYRCCRCMHVALGQEGRSKLPIRETGIVRVRENRRPENAGGPKAKVSRDTDITKRRTLGKSKETRQGRLGVPPTGQPNRPTVTSVGRRCG
jgi:hypothetical protein